MARVCIDMKYGPPEGKTVAVPIREFLKWGREPTIGYS